MASSGSKGFQFQKDIKLSSEMEFIIHNVAKNKQIKGTSLDLSALTHIIIKDVKSDRKLKALTIARRLLYCCPLHVTKKHGSSSI